jgi:hypothetical protein
MRFSKLVTTHRSKFIPPLFIVWLVIVALACNLTDPTGPPTLVPRASPTPPATIGFATLSPQELPQQVETPAPSFDVELFNLLNKVETDRLMIHVDNLQNFYTRHVNSPFDLPDRGIGAAYRYILGQFQAIQAQEGRLHVFPHPFPLTWAGVNTTQYNVVAFIQGTEVGGGVILIGAHYDSRIANLDDGSSFAPGANDNASGMAAVIELARILSARDHRSSIMFVAFSAEEVGRRGSIAFVEGYLKSNPDIQLTAMINLDIIGSETGPDGSINFRQIRLFSAGPDTSPSRRLAREVEFIAHNMGLEMEILVQDREDRPDAYGDHSSFSDAGYPAVRFTEVNEEPQRRHTERDTIGDIQGRYITRATQTVLGVITGLADGPRPPRNLSLRDGDANVRTLVWETVPGAASYVVALRQPGALRYQYFDWPTNSVEWDGFRPDRFVAVAVAVKDERGLIGPLSQEFPIR